VSMTGHLHQIPAKMYATRKLVNFTSRQSLV